MFKFRMAFIEWPWMTKKDLVVFNVIMPERANSIAVPVDYFEAETLDEARAKAHAIIDKAFDHKAHMEQLERMAAEHKRKFAAEAADIKQVSELSIARAPKKPASPADDLLDLMGDVLGTDDGKKA